MPEQCTLPGSSQPQRQQSQSLLVLPPEPSMLQLQPDSPRKWQARNTSIIPCFCHSGFREIGSLIGIYLADSSGVKLFFWAIEADIEKVVAALQYGKKLSFALV